MEKLICRDVSTIRSFSGTVVIIDVLRAATSMCSLLHQGVKKIVLKPDTKACLAFKFNHPDALLLGEKHGYQIDQFDLGNSPDWILKQRLCGRTVAMLTSNCTRGVLMARNAASIYCAGFVNINATADHLMEHCPEPLLIVPMGNLDGSRCPADDACADYLFNYLSGMATNVETTISTIKDSTEAKRFFDPANKAFPIEDLIVCLTINKLPHLLCVKTSNSTTIIEK